MTPLVKKWEVLNTKAIINNLKHIFKSKDIGKLNNPTYKFVMNLGGFIAHYDINGFKSAYQDLRILIVQLEDSDDLQRPNRYIDDPFFQKKYLEVFKNYSNKKEYIPYYPPAIVPTTLPGIYYPPITYWYNCNSIKLNRADFEC